MHKRWVKIAIAVAAVVVLILILVPFFVNADSFRPTIQNELSSALGRPVTLSHISLSLFTGSLVAQNISIADDPAYSSTPFLQAKELRVGVELGRLIFHRSLHITTLSVDSPSINLIHAANGTWNFSSLGGASAQPAGQPAAQPAARQPAPQPASPQQPVAAPAFAANEIKIENASATISSLPAAGNPITCTSFNLTIKQFSFTQSFPVELSFKVPGDGSFHLKGTAGPVALGDVSLTPFQATLDLKHFDPLAAGFLQPSDGISMLADFNAQLSSSGGIFTSTGKIVASKLKLARNGSPAPHPVDIDYNTTDDLSQRAGHISDLAIHTGSVAAHLTGDFRHGLPEYDLNLHLSAPNLPVDQVEALLPSVGITLPTGARLTGGTLSATLAISGPVDATTIAGPVELDNSQLAGFDLGSKIQGINPLSGTSKGTEIRKLFANVSTNPQITQFTNIDAEIPIIGSATGSGTVSPSGALDFQLNARIVGLSQIGNAVTGAVNGLLGRGSQPLSNRGGIPLTITGTTSSPSIHADVGKMAKQALGIGGGSNGQKPSAAKTLKGLLGH